MSPALVSYVLGAANVRFAGFMLALVGIVPGYLVQVYIGVASRHVVHMAGRTESRIVADDVMLLGGLLASVVALLLITRAALRAVDRAAVSKGATPA